MSKEVLVSKLITYPAPEGAIENNDFTVRVRMENGEWQQLFSYKVKVDMHNVREASMVYFDFSGTVELEITVNSQKIDTVILRPQSYNVHYSQEKNKVSFKLKEPRKISFEVNGDRYHNLHIFANPIEEDTPCPEDNDVLYIEPGFHKKGDILSKISSPDLKAKVIYFAPGMHNMEGVQFRIPSGKTVYIAGGAVVVGAVVCDKVENVTVRGRGILYLADIEKTTYFRGVEINYCKNISVEGIITVDPPHYSILIGQSENIKIKNFKSFSTRGWCDGIDSMASSNVIIDDVFLRTSDDCIATYASRGEFIGDSRNIKAMNSILWADVAHPLMIGVHGDHSGDGNTIENIYYENIDILEHHEPQMDYLGCMTINAGDKNYVRNVTYENIRVEQFEHGRLIDLRVFYNKRYNPAPGRKIENINFKNIFYNGSGEEASQIFGYDEERTVENVTIENLFINGKHVLDAEAGNIKIGDFVHNVTFK